MNGLSKTTVGLASVDNTSDANKTISTAMSTALAGKQDTIGNTSTTRISASFVGSGTVNNTRYRYIANLTSDAQSQITTLRTDKANKASPVFSGNTTYGASSTVDFTNCTISNFPLTTPCAIGQVSSTEAISNGRGPAGLTSTRQTTGYFRISWTNAHTITYIVNATACPSTNANYSCMVQKFTIATTNFFVAVRDSSNVAQDVDFMFVIY